MEKQYKKVIKNHYKKLIKNPYKMNRYNHITPNEYQKQYKMNRYNHITPNEYQKQCMTTLDFKQYNLEYLGLGLAGETGEVIEIIKKALYQGHDLDEEHLAIELGDVAWYLSVIAGYIGYDLETIFKKNINKTHKRYKHGFKPSDSINRKEGDI